ncbi:hypothetical protein M5X06_32400, partial [Paenibacillus alvei]|uniref:hypothetical protein n=1 Tax=Paenibacillus alvei TaxID=44250 RepID=UPI002283060F
TKRWDNTVYNLKPLIDALLNLVGEQPMPESKDSYEIYWNDDPSEPQVRMGTEPQVRTKITNQNNNIKMIDRLIDSQSLREFLKSKPENLKDEHIEVIAQINQAYINHPGFTQNLFIEKISACLKTYKRNFKACLKKSIENELNKPTKPLKQTSKAKKPVIPTVESKKQEELSDEELQRIIEKARKLDEKLKITH